MKMNTSRAMRSGRVDVAVHNRAGSKSAVTAVVGSEFISFVSVNALNYRGFKRGHGIATGIPGKMYPGIV